MVRVLLSGITAMLLILLSFQNTQAQGKKKPAAPMKEVPVTLGSIGLTEVNLTRQKFLEQVKGGLIDMSSIGGGKITGFHLTVITHNLYEDSLGAPLILQDIYSNYVTGAQFDPYLIDYFSEKLKVGDTVFLDKITVLQPTGKVLPGISRKFAIVRKP